MTLEFRDSIQQIEFPLGIAASNLANDVNPDIQIPHQAGDLVKYLQSVKLGVEWQMEGDVTSLIDALQGDRPEFVGVHLPTSDIDIQSGEDGVTYALRKNLDALRHAQTIGADYAVIHLQTHDHWERLSMRADDNQRSFEIIEQLLVAYVQHGLTVPILIENVEFPKFPATLSELQQVVQFIRKHGNIDLGIAIDFGHLWHSGRIIGENTHQRAVAPFVDGLVKGTTTFSEYLRASLNSVREQLRLIHATGCVDHRTHDRPLVKSGYTQNELDLSSSLQVLHDVATGMLQPPRIINEAIGTPYSTMGDDCKGLRDFIYARTSN